MSQEAISNVRTTRSFAAEGVEYSKYGSQIGDPDNGLGEESISEQPLLGGSLPEGSFTATAATNATNATSAAAGGRGTQPQGGCTSCSGLCRCTFCGWIPAETSSYQLGAYKAIGYGAFGESGIVRLVQGLLLFDGNDLTRIGSECGRKYSTNQTNSPTRCTISPTHPLVRFKRGG